MASHPPHYTGQPGPGARLPLPVTAERSLADIERDNAERTALVKAVRDTLEQHLADHPAFAGRKVEVLPDRPYNWRWVDLAIDGETYGLSVMRVRS